VPLSGFSQFLESVVLSENIVNYLNEHNMIKTLTFIFEEFFKKENSIPIYAFKEKQNSFYYYDDETKKWSEMEKNQIISLFYYIDRKVQSEITNWNIKYHEKIKYNDSWAQTFNKLVAKANTLSYREETTLNRLKGVLFNLLKCEVKRYVEYEFDY
jgi:O-methyltransferase involved in polyketide biosynthesis